MIWPKKRKEKKAKKMYVWSHAIMNGTGSITKLTVPSTACHMYVLLYYSVQAGQNTNTKQSACVICMEREKMKKNTTGQWWFHDLGGFMILVVS